jgi:hypothetical protein
MRPYPLCLLFFVCSAASSNEMFLAETMPPVGFRIDADTQYDSLGRYGGVGSAGDLNGDGIGDFYLVRESNGGAVLVVMGRDEPFEGPYGMDVASWGGGFSLRGSFAGGYVSTAEHAGDVNDDGFDDLLFGAPWNFPYVSGYSCVLFGREAFPDSLRTDAANLGTTCFSGSNAYDNIGRHLSAVGDVDGDGYADFVIAAPLADNAAPNSGSVYLVFGQPEFPAHVQLDNPEGVRVIRFDGASTNDRFGGSVAYADMDGDGYTDIAIGAEDADGGTGRSGVVYVIHGRPDWPEATVSAEEIPHSYGFRIVSSSATGTLGRSLAGGDFNGDRLGDLVLGDGLGLMNWVGNAHVVFGTPERRSGTLSVAELDGSNGFSITGIHPFDRTGEWVGNAGDFNGNGIEDFVLAGIYEDTPASSAGVAHLVFGRKGPRAASMRMDELTGSERLSLMGSQQNGQCGVSSASAGDIDRSYSNHLMIACNGEGPPGEWMGSVYVLKGEFIRTIFSDGLEAPGAGVR